jgi:hypothetical protein
MAKEDTITRKSRNNIREIMTAGKVKVSVLRGRRLIEQCQL